MNRAQARADFRSFRPPDRDAPRIVQGKRRSTFNTVQGKSKTARDRRQVIMVRGPRLSVAITLSGRRPRGLRERRARRLLREGALVPADGVVQAGQGSQV